MDFLTLSLRLLVSRALDAVFPPRDGEKAVRKAREDDVLALMAPLKTRGTVSIARFRTSLMRSLIHEAKYRGSARAQELLGSLLAGYLAQHPEDNAFLVPVPLSPKRLRERGFNQCEVIARAALAQPPQAIRFAPGLLERVRDTEHQTALTRAGRQANVAGAFAVPETQRPLDPAHTYIVFDDVLTTGATLESAIAALRAAGAERIVPLTLAN